MAEQYSWISANNEGYSAGKFSDVDGNIMPWSRSTVADGKWLNREMILPFSGRDQYLLKSLNQTYDECSAFSGYLNEEIRIINARADVIDVVGSHDAFTARSAELVSGVDISDRDVIKILNDVGTDIPVWVYNTESNVYVESTVSPSNQQTYYRWLSAVNDGPSGWEYVGDLEPYYKDIDLTENSITFENTAPERNYTINTDLNRFIQMSADGNTGTIGITDDFISSASQVYNALSSISGINEGSISGPKVNHTVSNYSLAQGSANSASYDSFAQGEKNEANGQSIAAGLNNYAKSQSQALGNSNSAYSDGFVAGSNNSATTASFAQGSTNYARNSSFAQGTSNSASTQSFAQGKNNSADYDAFAQGLSAFANQEGLAQGIEVTAKNKSFAQGSKNDADINSFAQGESNTATTASFAQGYNNYVEEHSFGQGENITATYTGFSQGIGNDVTGDSFGQGISNTAYNDAFAQGSGNNVELNSFTQGNKNKATAQSFAQGKGNTATYYSFAQGLNNSVDNDDDGQGRCFAQGMANTARYLSFAQGDRNDVTNRSFAQGSANTAWSNGFACGLRNHADGGFANGADNIAVGTGALAIGVNNYAGTYAQALGHGVKIDGSTESLHRGGMAIGTFNKTTADIAFVIGNGINDSNRSDLYWIDYNGNVFTNGNISAKNFYINGNPIDSIVSAKFSAYNGSNTLLTAYPISSFGLYANTAKYITVSTSNNNRLDFSVADALINSASSGYQAKQWINTNGDGIIGSANSGAAASAWIVSNGTTFMPKSQTFAAKGNPNNFNTTFSYTGFTLSAGSAIGFNKNGNTLTISAEAGIPDGTMVYKGITAQGSIGEKNLSKLCITDYVTATRSYQQLEYSAGATTNTFNLWSTTASTAANLVDATIIPVIDPIGNRLKNEYTTLSQLGEALSVGGNYVSAGDNQKLTMMSADNTTFTIAGMSPNIIYIV